MKMRYRRALSLVCTASLIGTLTALSVPQPPAPVLYWDPEGTSFATTASGTWDSTSTRWSTSSAQSSSTVAWIPGWVACFCAGTSVTGLFSVQLTNTVSCSGIYNGGLTPPHCSISLTGTGGAISLPAGTNIFNNTGGGTTINIPITGSGALVLAGTGSQGLNANNTYSGGTQLGTTTNDFTGLLTVGNSAFGTGPIKIVSSGFTIDTPAPGTVTITNAWLPDPVQINFAPFSSLILSGPWTLPNSGTVNIGDTSSGTTTISGVISGANGFINKTGTGKLVLNGNNTYTGGTTISTGTLVIGANGSISNTWFVDIYSGAKLDVSAFNSYTFADRTSLGNRRSSSAPALIAGASGGTIKVSTNDINLIYVPFSSAGDSAHPCIEITSGSLTLNGNKFIIFNGSTYSMGPGVYRLIQDDGGPIMGPFNSAPQVEAVVGYGLAANCTATLALDNTNLDLLVAAAPSFNHIAANSVMDSRSGVIINVTVNGQISAPPTYPNSGESVTVNLNGAIQTVKTSTSGNFSATYPFVSIPYSPTNYPLTLSYGGDTVLAPVTNNTVIPANSFIPIVAVSASGAPPISLYATNTAGVTMFVWSCTNASVPTTLWTLEGQMTEQPLNDGSGKSFYSLSVNPEPAPMFYVAGPKNQWPFASPTPAQWIAADGNETFYSTNTTINPLGVLQLPSAPVILEQPTSKTVFSGKNVGFNYAYSSTTVATNQWYFNLTNPLPAPTGFILLTNVTTANSGTYNFVVTSDFGTATSDAATLTVLPPPNVTVQSTAGSIELTATTLPSASCFVQTATNLTPPVSWHNLTTSTADTNGFIDFIDTNAPITPNLFYRLQFP